MTLEQDQSLVRRINEQRKAAGITYTARTWAEKWTDVAWLQQRVTELERWHVPESGPGHPRLDDVDGPECVFICRGEHGPEDGCEWVEYVRLKRGMNDDNN